MYKVLENTCINEGIYKLVIEAPLISSKFLPGEFVIVMCYKDSERIPLTIADTSDNTITCYYLVTGASTYELSNIKEELYSVVGPLGNASALINEKNKNILLVGGGIGIAAILPQAKYFSKYNNVDIVYGAKSKDKLILLDELREYSNNLYITTDDGSSGFKGNVVDYLEQINKTFDVCVCIGPLVMMKYVSLYAKNNNLKCIVSLNPIMVDGTGMCGSCRVLINNEVKFACVDGPEFDGDLVDFDNLIKRNNLYKTIEGREYLRILEGDTHHGTCEGDIHE